MRDDFHWRYATFATGGVTDFTLDLPGAVGCGWVRLGASECVWVRLSASGLTKSAACGVRDVLRIAGTGWDARQMSSHSDHPTLFDVGPYLRPPPPRQDAPPGYVYAVLMPSHAVKFGWTGRAPKTRARELGGVLLAWRPGTVVDESAVHQMLHDWRIGRTEDFWPAPPVWRMLAAGGFNAA